MIIDGFVVLVLACWAFCFRIPKMIYAFVYFALILVSTLERCINIRVPVVLGSCIHVMETIFVI